MERLQATAPGRGWPSSGPGRRGPRQKEGRDPPGRGPSGRRAADAPAFRRRGRGGRGGGAWSPRAGSPLRQLQGSGPLQDPGPEFGGHRGERLPERTRPPRRTLGQGEPEEGEERVQALLARYPETSSPKRRRGWRGGSSRSPTGLGR